MWRDIFNPELIEHDRSAAHPQLRRAQSRNDREPFVLEPGMETAIGTALANNRATITPSRHHHQQRILENRLPIADTQKRDFEECFE